MTRRFEKQKIKIKKIDKNPVNNIPMLIKLDFV